MAKTRKTKIRSVPKKNLTLREQHVIELAKTAWSKTLKEFFFLWTLDRIGEK